MRWIALGAEHVLLGLDHLAFLAGLLFVSRLDRRLVFTITAFTLAHSITLALAVLDLVHPASALVEALFRRMGAFSLHAGVVTVAGAVLGRKHRALMTGVLVLWMVDGLAFFATDRAAFMGTPYFMAKQVIGGFWALALVVHLLQGRRAGDMRAS